VIAAPPLLIGIVLALIAYCFVTAVLSVLSSRVHLEVQRHNLLVHSKLLRLEYLNSLEEKMAGVEDDFDEVLEDDHPAAA